MRGRAVVKLASPSVAYLAYHEAFFNPTANTIFLNAVVVRLTRAALAPTWNAAEIFRFNGLNMPDQANGAISNTFWQDLSPMGFDIGNGGTELHIVVRHPRQVEGDPDDAFYFHCVDTGLTTCQTAGGGLNPGWTLERFPMNVGTSRFQPWVAAVQTAKVSLATVSWYQQITFSQFYPMGVIVGSDRPLPHTPVQLAPLYSPCATSVDPNTGIGTYGDYESTVATPYFAPDGPITNLSPPPSSSQRILVPRCASSPATRLGTNSSGRRRGGREGCRRGPPLRSLRMRRLTRGRHARWLYAARRDDRDRNRHERWLLEGRWGRRGRRG